MLRFLAGVVAGLVVTACSDFQQCSSQINQKFLPADTTIGVGEQFTAQVLVTTCDGRQILNSSPTWHSTDPAIASVDSLTGRVTGDGQGQTTITATGGFYTLKGNIPVTVK
jgi:uncharacterized protein YjdB